LRDADADHARHLGIIDAGAYHGAEPGAVEQQPKTNCHDDGNGDDGETIGREYQRAGADKSCELLRRRHRNRIAAPDHQAEIGGHEGNAERD
jgi:hypothetical protein